MVWSYRGVGKVGANLIFNKGDEIMTIKVYKVYFGNELDKIFLSKKKALEYKENLEIYRFDENINIVVEKGYVYV